MAVAHTTALELLGKQVSFIDKRVSDLTDKSFVIFERNCSGIVTQIILGLNGIIQISIDDGDFFSFDEISELQVLDDCSVVLGTITKSPSAIDDRSIVDAAFTGLITDNKDFIDSLSK